MALRAWQSLAAPALGFLMTAAGCGTPTTTSSPTGARHVAQVASPAAVPIPRFSRVDDPRHPDRQIYRSGDLSDDAFARLAESGFRTIVAVQDNEGWEASDVAHEREVASRYGLTFINLPIPSDGVPTNQEVETFIQVAAMSDRGPVLIHCYFGRDRTGAMIAAYRIHEDDYSADQALAEMESFGYRPARYPALERFVRDYAVNHD